jgi:regulator of sigma E protease
LIPFGGYVKIHGENPDEDSISGPDSARSFVNAKKWKQVCVLVAGVGMNIIFAWILISISFMFGTLTPVGEQASEYSKYVKETQVVLTSVMPDSPAEKAGLKQGDKLLTVEGMSGKDLNTTRVRELIEKDADGKINISFDRAGEVKNIVATAEISKTENRKVIGVYMENVGEVKLNPVLALWEGGKLTLVTFKQVAVGLGGFLFSAVRGQGDFSQVSGPVGIVGLVGDAAHFGLAYFLGFVAFISLNLAVINLIPFPALDGGRVLFVIIEAIIRRPIKPVIANSVNTVGFLILIGLMLVITYRDIMKFF